MKSHTKYLQSLKNIFYNPSLLPLLSPKPIPWKPFQTEIFKMTLQFSLKIDYNQTITSRKGLIPPDVQWYWLSVFWNFPKSNRSQDCCLDSTVDTAQTKDYRSEHKSMNLQNTDFQPLTCRQIACTTMHLIASLPFLIAPMVSPSVYFGKSFTLKSLKWLHILKFFGNCMEQRNLSVSR